ncbi:hypothetical protein A1O1_05212 [Capronia coronata CBS 617.96]|uniref:Uncharacterized protein n=1 Tax=Capronia coronata CBS 617.96 TaxID=1182541 RepID=W9Y624_9EURO|nr:uncharacterized protein A1O1_05212 [Capronia coronata CBS 617.96]EXJ88282.1 hypothetical protein A1O1_05212 [Capronia coronata CBS 617.96]
MRFAAADEPASLAEVCKLAWHTFYGMQKASEDFENLRFEVWTIAISLDSLHSVGTTSLLINRQPDRARWALTFSKILSSLASALRPLHSMVRLYLSSGARDRASIKNWLLHPDVVYEGLTIQDFRRKLSMLVESLNVFLSCLTHAELARAKSASESEEFRVLSEVTSNVLHKWDQDVSTGIRRPEAPKPIEPPGYVNDDVKSYMMPLLNGGSGAGAGAGSAGVGLGVQSSYVPQAAMRQPRRASPPSSQHPNGPSNLDDIEQGFRSHMHAMRRIREQLRQQKINNNHLTDQRSAHFPEMSRTTNPSPPRTNGHLPLTPITPILQRETTSDSTQSRSSSDFSGDYADASSNNSTSSLNDSEGGSVISNYHPEETKLTLIPFHPQSQSHSQSCSEPARKRKRQAEFRFKTGLEAENMHSYSSGSSDDGGYGRRQRKTALEELLTTVLFFDN